MGFIFELSMYLTKLWWHRDFVKFKSIIFVKIIMTNYRDYINLISLIETCIK